MSFKKLTEYVGEVALSFLETASKTISWLQDSGEGYWDDIRVPLEAVKTGGSKQPEYKKITDDGAGSNGVNAYFFDAVAEEEVYFSVQIPHTWREETPLKPHLHFTVPTNGTAGQRVKWGFEYALCCVGDTFTTTTTTFTTTIAPVDSDMVAKKHYIAGLPDIDTTGCTISSMILCRLFRDTTDVEDTYPDEVALMEFDFHFQNNTPGSRQEYIK